MCCENELTKTTLLFNQKVKIWVKNPRRGNAIFDRIYLDFNGPSKVPSIFLKT